MIEWEPGFLIVFICLAFYEENSLDYQIFGISLQTISSTVVASTIMQHSAFTTLEATVLSISVMVIAHLKIIQRARLRSLDIYSEEAIDTIMNIQAKHFIGHTISTAMLAPFEWCLGMQPTIFLRPGLIFPYISPTYWQIERISLHTLCFIVKTATRLLSASRELSEAWYPSDDIPKEAPGHFINDITVNMINNTEGSHPLRDIRLMAQRGFVDIDHATNQFVIQYGLEPSAHTFTSRGTQPRLYTFHNDHPSYAINKLSRSQQQLYHLALRGKISMQDLMCLGIWSDQTFSLKTTTGIAAKDLGKHEACQYEISSLRAGLVQISTENIKHIQVRTDHFLFNTPNKIKESLVYLFIALKRINITSLPEPVIDYITKWCYILHINKHYSKQGDLVSISMRSLNRTNKKPSEVIIGHGLFAKQALTYLVNKPSYEYSVRHLSKQTSDHSPETNRSTKQAKNVASWLVKKF